MVNLIYLEEILRNGKLKWRRKGLKIKPKNCIYFLQIRKCLFVHCKLLLKLAFLLFYFLQDATFWLDSGKAEIDVALNRLKSIVGNSDPLLSSVKRPKNLVLFIGDGLGISTVTAARIYKGQSRFGLSGEETNLVWEDFPEVALLKVILSNKRGY